MSDHIPDPTKMIQDTPRTDAAYFKPDATMYDLAGEMKRIERELTTAQDRIKRLEEAGDAMEAWLRDERLNAVQYTVSKWRKAKEAKP
jgi:predicted  nucleic acid-binding Zn-ribbon protein